MKRCEWAKRSELEQSYHDNEWGAEIHDDRTLLEFLILEGAQTGLSWSTQEQKESITRRCT
jgi:DNA-3-methyladenine glycosylase I